MPICAVTYTTMPGGVVARRRWLWLCLLMVLGCSAATSAPVEIAEPAPAPASASASASASEPSPEPKANSVVPLMVTMSSHDGTPHRAGAIELFALDGRTSLAVCEFETTSSCDLSTDHRGYAFLQTFAVPGPRRFALRLTDEPVSLHIMLGPVSMTSRPTFEFTPATSVAARTAALSLDVVEAEHEWDKRKHLAAVAPEKKDSSAQQALDALGPRIQRVLESTNVPEVRAAALVLSLSAWGIEEQQRVAYADAAIAELSPTDETWAIADGGLLAALKLSSRDTQAYADAVIAGHPSPAVAGSVLAERLRVADASDAEAHARELFDALRAPRFEGTAAQSLSQDLDPERPIKRGKPMPAVVAWSLSRPGEPSRPFNVTDTMKGRVYMLELWAKWCVGCMAAMPHLHELYDEFHPRGLEFVSISMQSQSVLEEVRKTWPMPWMHALSESATTEIYETFGMSLPRLVLVDQNGIILWSGRPTKDFPERLDAMLPPA